MLCTLSCLVVLPVPFIHLCSHVKKGSEAKPFTAWSRVTAADHETGISWPRNITASGALSSSSAMLLLFAEAMTEKGLTRSGSICCTSCLAVQCQCVKQSSHEDFHQEQSKSSVWRDSRIQGHFDSFLVSMIFLNFRTVSTVRTVQYYL